MRDSYLLFLMQSIHFFERLFIVQKPAVISITYEKTVPLVSAAWLQLVQYLYIFKLQDTIIIYARQFSAPSWTEPSE